MKKLTKFFCMALCFGLALNTFACGGGKDPEEQDSYKQQQVNASLDSVDDFEFTYSQLGGVDEYGNTVPAASYNNGKYVGIFYCLWLGHHDTPVYDITKLLEENPEALWAVEGENYDDSISPNAAFHYWGEPLYGYYYSGDQWVIRRHLELLANAGVDFLLLDVTNANIYPAVSETLIKTVVEMRKEGYRVPQLVYMCHNLESASVSTLNTLYTSFYQNDEYEEAWFRADEVMNPSGKPLVIGRFTNAVETGLISQEVQDAFWLKEMQWPTTTGGESPDSIPWMDWTYPQFNFNGVMNVSVVQHINGTWSSEAYRYPDKGTMYNARGWTENTPFSETDPHGTEEENVLRGTNFRLQWENALKQDLDMITVTGWNEWIAQKLSRDVGDIPTPSYRPGTNHAVFVDNFNLAYSRDAEMMKGGYGDNYYMTLVEMIHRFKGGRVSESDNVYKSERVKIQLDDLSTWNEVKHSLVDIGLDCYERNSRSYDSRITYTDYTNRNDIDTIQIANDDSNLYVKVKVKGDSILMPRDENEREQDWNWMNLYLSVGEEDGWKNYDFVINRYRDRNGVTSVERLKETETVEVGNAGYFVSGNTIVYAIPLSVLGVRPGENIGVKAADNLQKFRDMDDFYISGDSAPLGRLYYTYKIV